MADKIIHRSGRLRDLPILDTAEVGLATDSDQVFIGNQGINIKLITENQFNTLDNTVKDIIKTLYIGGWDNMGGGGRFMQYELPPSTTTVMEAQGWSCDPSIAIPDTVCASCVHNGFTYLLATKALYVVDHMTNTFTVYQHGFTIPLQGAWPFTSPPVICYFRGYVIMHFDLQNAMNDVKLHKILFFNITTKVFREENIPQLVGNLSLYADDRLGIMAISGGGLDSAWWLFYYELRSTTARTTYIPCFIRTSPESGHAWTNISNVNNNPTSRNYNNPPAGATWQIAPETSSGITIGNEVVFFQYGRIADTNTTAGTNTATAISGTVLRKFMNQDFPFVPESQKVVATFQHNYDKFAIKNFGDKYFVVYRNNIMGYDPIANVVTTPAIPSPSEWFWPQAIVPRPDINEVQVFTANGLYHMKWGTTEVPVDRAPALIIYKDQYFHGNHLLHIKNQDGDVLFTIDEKWQQATEDMEIKLGQYTSSGRYLVYIENRPLEKLPIPPEEEDPPEEPEEPIDPPEEPVEEIEEE